MTNMGELRDWATMAVCLWIENDSSFHDTATNYAEYGTEDLRGHLTRLLFDRDLLADVERSRLTRDDLHTLSLVIDDLASGEDGTTAREAFDAVNWDYISASLCS